MRTISNVVIPVEAKRLSGHWNGGGKKSPSFDKLRMRISTEGSQNSSSS